MAVGIASIPGQGPPSSDDADMDVYSEDEEVDQLDSDLDEEEDIPLANGSVSSNRSRTIGRKSGERVPGHSLIPTERVESIMHADGSGGHMSKEAMFMLSVATEEFIKRLAGAGYHEASSERRSVVNYHDVAFATSQRPEFMFLQDTIPTPIPLSEAMQLRAAKEKEILEDNPAISVTPVPLPTTFIPSGPTISHPGGSKPRAPRIRQTNGKEKTNGTATASGTKRQRDSKGRWSLPGQGGEDGESEAGSVGAGASASASGRPSRVRTRPLRISQDESPQAYSAPPNGRAVPQNGTSPNRNHAHGLTAEYAGWAGMPMTPPPAPQPAHASDMADPRLAHPDGRWSPGQYTGPASGYLEDRRVLFGRGGMAGNPGRTIYSAQRPPAR
ncbi:hypothetical protein BKA93DRAFT_827078 [Sparassis latifolia]